MTSNLTIKVASGEALDVRAFNIEQEISTNFEVSVLVHAENPEVSFDDVLGQAASFTLHSRDGAHAWHGVCNHIEQEQVEEKGVSTYRVTIVPKLWLLTQRRNHRMFQQVSEVEIVQKLLGEWGIQPTMRLKGDYKKRKYKVQYGESDFDFMSRMLEDAGISFYFEQAGAETNLVLDDSPHTGAPSGPAIPFRPRAGNATQGQDHFSSVEFKQRVRPGKFTIQDHDYRKPAAYPLKASAGAGLAAEQNLERYHYNPGAFLFRDKGGDTPVADDRGASRSDEAEGEKQAQRRLASNRAEGKRIKFSTSAFQLGPGVVYQMSEHPRSDLAKPLLVVAAHLHGSFHGDWDLHGESVTTDEAFHPPIKTAKPQTKGVESATVVGASGDEIHCDEFGRIRVQFHWDREGQFDEKSSCWIHVNQPWGGTGYGASSLPRVGQEVLVDFLGGDPDRPVITGRVYTALQTTPYKLPDNKTQSGWKSNSTGGGGGFNEIKFEDSNGRELYSMQAQKDFQGLVKHDSAHAIGNDSTHSIGQNYTHAVGNDETRSVGQDQSTTVKRNRSLAVQGDHQQSTVGQLISSVGKDQLSNVLGSLTSTAGGQRMLKTTGDFASQALSHSITSDVGTTITVGQSMIHIGPDSIIIQSPKVLLNPGAEAAGDAAAGAPAPAAGDC